MTPTQGSLDALVGPLTGKAARRRVGLAVGVRVGGITSLHAAGVVEDDGGLPTADTVFQIGSVTKVVTALLLAEAVRRGELSLDTPLSEHVPGLPEHPSGVPVTLGHLATHTSGLPGLPPGLRRLALRNRLDPYRAFGDEQLETALPRTRLRAQPGTRYRYSNYGFGLLGQALSRHAQTSYGSLVAARVTGPLRLADTAVVLRPDQWERKAQGHARRHRPVPDWELSALAGAGALYSTVRDLLRLADAFIEPSATGSAGAIELARTPRFRVSSRLEIALGWHLSPVGRSDQQMMWHNGGTGGFRSFVAVLPGTRASVVVLGNSARSVDRLGLTLVRNVVRTGTAG